MTDYTEFLAAHVLAQDEVVTYRTLSRALKVNVHVAKQMLYDFHATQNAIKPGSVIATYAIFGKLKAKDTDVSMEDNPELTVVSDPIDTQTLTIVAQGRLERILATYESVSALHVYSIGITLGNDLQLISQAPALCEPDAKCDPLENIKVYGGISNSHTHRRSHRPNPIAPITQPIAKVEAPSAKQNFKALEPGKSTTKLPFGKAPPASSTSKANVALSESSTKTSQKTLAMSQTATSKKAPGKGSNIMQSFAKAASRPAKPKPEAEKGTSEEPPEDTVMLSDDGDDDESIINPELEAEAEIARKAREEKQSQLRRMMDEDDEESEDTKEEEDVPMEEVSEEVAPAELEKTEIITASSNGRKRGRRQVMKKKQTMDSNGYFVTVQEKAWESFSEDEEPPAAKHRSSAAPASAATSTKPKKGAPKGQGNIMSFFQKR
ncbi:hypothetical protein CFIMG_000904RA [Ceratocystis fimbriata CBS 114723]|uniref:DNA polymerase delta subunit 3 n=1 Tax=Ceratocystis fimbriata CBS 114723 TaxID=1035309 RepID=A0A2C5XGF4_9PEZI|nr:hypothetical protein CFIMG_000904RA [Ceratocystis fimbriata CBS 114723]